MIPGSRPPRKHGHRMNALLPTFISKCTAYLLIFILIPQILTPHAPPCLTPVSASGILTDLVSSTVERIFPPEDYIDDDFETKTLNIIEISEMRARDIKRRLARSHGYDPDELSRLIDKKDLINVLSFEEHKVYQQGADRRKWIRFKTTVIYTCVAVIIVMFWPLLKHALEVAHVNFVVYTDRRKHEMRRCREFNTFKGYFGIFLLSIVDILSFWLSTSVLLSWVMRSKYFFPVPSIPIKPAQLITGAMGKGGDAGALGNYGINVGPMVISWLFRFLGRQVEAMIGRAMAEALQKQKRREKDEMKRMRKVERAKEKEAKREARRQATKAKEERAARRNETEESESSDDENSCNSYSGMTASNVTRNNLDMNIDHARDTPGTPLDFHDID
mmetsp:Transcript_15789/g.28658  ORF Transcript_15789/g.28658 Transcript_15789/m.28658 type:complete len:389 (-) Transcript_15789:126-1292(-)